mmetsp:Transcript_30196/g.59805  ORF Transcript_30196/g.59805 Transcript_30196/m.59805 type:complete len:261 (+) Transcript_30196:327-1109(+)
MIFRQRSRREDSSRRSSNSNSNSSDSVRGTAGGGAGGAGGRRLRLRQRASHGLLQVGERAGGGGGRGRAVRVLRSGGGPHGHVQPHRRAGPRRRPPRPDRRRRPQKRLLEPRRARRGDGHAGPGRPDPRRAAEGGGAEAPRGAHRTLRRHHRRTAVDRRYVQQVGRQTGRRRRAREDRQVLRRRGHAHDRSRGKIRPHHAPGTLRVHRRERTGIRSLHHRVRERRGQEGVPGQGGGQMIHDQCGPKAAEQRRREHWDTRS